jgi:hypothetical protein
MKLQHPIKQRATHETHSHAHMNIQKETQHADTDEGANVPIGRTHTRAAVCTGAHTGGGAHLNDRGLILLRL